MTSIRLSTNAAGPTATLDSPRIVGEKKGIAVLTSGGDAQGMNAAVRAVVRTAIRLGADAFAIINGYQGMVDDNIKQLGWHDVGRILPEGGTFIGTARCAAFMTRDGRKLACKNLLKRGIDRLVIIGGDGSLTGASILHKEWASLLQEILEDQKKDNSTQFDPEVILKRHTHLRIVGLVGSIDNDMCGTDMTIGADTALNHIVRAVDAISSTAASHQRDFVVEVMGRNCGWLALYGCIATASDWMLIPERPVEDNWKEKIAQAIANGKKLGKKSTIVILAEGARDIHGNLITSDEVKKALDQAGYEARVTVLGHVQRGGSPTAWDRNMTTIQGWKAAELALLEPLDTEPQLVGIISNKIIVNPLHACLHQNAEITQAIKRRDFQTAMKLRGNFFPEAYDLARILTSEKQTKDQVKPLKIGMLHAGACAPGMNSAARALVRLALNRGHRVFGINNGVEGLLTGTVQEMQWITVNGWAKQGGALLGTRRADPAKIDYKDFADALVKQDLDALVIIGGWDGYELALQFEKHKKEFTSPKLQNFPITLVPASISNNLPCSDFSIGCDTALNNIIEAVDKIKQSAVSSSRVFVIEVMGSNGYLAVMSAIATGADKVYIPEEKLKLDRLQNDINDFTNAFKQHTQSFLVINNESSSKVFTTPTLAKLFEDQSEGLYKVRTAVLGHLQQGGAPTGADRILATILSQKAIQYLEEQFASGTPKSGCIGTLDGNVAATVLDQMEQEMDLKKRRAKKQWWLQYKELCEWVTKAPNLYANC